MNCSNHLDLFFQDFDSVNVTDSSNDQSEDPAALTIMCIPAIGTALLWLLWETSPLSTSILRSHHCKLLIAFSALAIAAQTIVVWHFFELLDCEDTLDNSMSWGVASATGLVLFNSAVVLGIGNKSARASTLMLYGIVLGCLFGEWSLRGGIEISNAAPALFVVQQLQCILCVFQINKVIPSRGKRRVSACSLPSIDILHRFPATASSQQAYGISLPKPGLTWFS